MESNNDKDPRHTPTSTNNTGNNHSGNNNNENLLHQTNNDFLDSQSMQIFNAADKDFFNQYENMLRQNKMTLINNKGANNNNNNNNNVNIISPSTVKGNNNIQSPAVSHHSPLSINNVPNNNNNSNNITTQSSPPTNNSSSLFQSHVNNSSGISGSSGKQAQPQQQQCDHCRRRQVDCIVLPSNNGSLKTGSSSSCVQCQSKNLKCNFNRSVSSLKRGMSEDAGVNANVSNNNNNNNNTVNNISRANNNSNSPNNVINLQQQFLIQQQQNKQLQQQQHEQQQQQSQAKRKKVQYPRSSFYIGDNNMIFDNFIFQNFPLDKADQFKVDDTFNIRKVSQDVMFLLKDDYEENSFIRTDLALEEIESTIRPNGFNLVQLFFNKLHNYLPVLHKEVFLEKYQRSFKEFSPSLLGIVYLLALQYIPDPKIPNKSQIESKIYNLVMSTFNATIAKPRLSSIQSGLLILHYRIYYRNWDNNWNLIQQIVSIGENLGLGIDCQDWKLPKWERCLRRRLGWLLFIQEKWISVIESKISHIVIGRNFNLKVLTDTDFNESDEKTSVEVFKNFIELSLILTEILEKFYNHLPAADQPLNRNNFQTVLSLAKPIQIQLRSWYQTMQSSHIKYPNFLQFNYYICEIMLHRKIILNITNHSSSPNNNQLSNSFNNQQQQPTMPKIPIELVKICKDAAKTRLLAVLKFLKTVSTPPPGSPGSIDTNSEYWHLTSVNNLYLISTFSLILLLNSNEDGHVNPADHFSFGDNSNNGLNPGLTIDDDLKKLIVEFREILASGGQFNGNLNGSGPIRFIQIARLKIELIFSKFEAILNNNQKQLSGTGGNQFNIYQTPSNMFVDFNSPMPHSFNSAGFISNNSISNAGTPNSFNPSQQLHHSNNNGNNNNIYHSPMVNSNNNINTPTHHSPILNNSIPISHSPLNNQLQKQQQHQSPHN